MISFFYVCPYKKHSDMLQDAHRLYSLSHSVFLSHTHTPHALLTLLSLFLSDVVNKLFSFFDEVVMDTDSL